MEKKQKARIRVTFGAVMLLVIGFVMSILLPIINGVDIGNFFFLGMIVITMSTVAWSFRTMNKKDKERGSDSISNTKYYAVIMAVVIALPLAVMILTYFDMGSNYQLQKDYNVESQNITPVFGIVLLLVGILVYDKYFKKNRRNGKGEDRHGWTENQKQEVRDRQGGVCNKCGNHPPRWEYHHKNGHSSDNRLSNCEALCPNCHSVKTHG